ncbi:hypothetical protein ACI2K4_25325 [Micromonospora sp. NPDC050397]|uniref:hypothetical protein n=1 Tax=Micromonospora sp. NPDC050397 TaxID=3364279 RepID=UPI00384DE36A
MTSPETTDPLAGTALERLTPYLPAVGTTQEPGVDPAARPLYDLVAARLRAIGEAEAFADFVRQPRNDSLVRRLLATAVRDDPAYAAALTAAVAAVPAGATTSQLPDGTAGSAVPLPLGGRVTGGSADSGTTAPVGSAPAPRLSRRTLLVGLGILVVVVAVVCLVARNILGNLDDSGGLTSQSTCAEFRQAPKEDRAAALRAIALARGLPELDTPLGLTAVTESCAAHPGRSLADTIATLRD